MLKAFKYRIYPDSEQIVLLEKHFGCTRLIYNLALETKIMAYSGSKKSLSWVDLSSQVVDLKKDLPFLKEVNSQSLQMSIKNLDAAYQSFFKRGSGFPKFKSKRDKQSFQCPQKVYVDFKKSEFDLPKFKTPIKMAFHRWFKGKIKTVTISKTPSGKYFASILVDNKIALPAKKKITADTAIGIDLNIGNTIVCSDGIKYENPKYLLASLDKLKWMQRGFSRMKMGSKRRERMRLGIAKLHEKIANQRKDFLHKLSSAIIKRCDTICMEDLGVSNMIKNRNLARAIGDAGWGMLETFIKYKSEWTGSNVLQIGRFEPSTKTCSCCGFVNHNLTLADREWTCPKCGTAHDRDINSGVNIKSFALNTYFGVAERTRQDVEASPLFRLRKRSGGKRAVETSKNQNVALRIAS